MSRPSEIDSVPSSDTDPPGYHVREKTEDGYPLMGSSPAEREEARQRAERIKRQAMRDHLFVGEGTYCGHWRTLTDRMTGDGRLVMRAQCGYPRDLHPSRPCPLTRVSNPQPQVEVEGSRP